MLDIFLLFPYRALVLGAIREVCAGREFFSNNRGRTVKQRLSYGHDTTRSVIQR